MSDFHLHLKMMAIIQFNKITFNRCKLKKNSNSIRTCIYEFLFSVPDNKFPF